MNKNAYTGGEEIAAILRNNIHFSGQVGDYVIHGAIEKLLEREQVQSIGFAEWMEGRWKKNNFFADDQRWLPYHDKGVDTSRLRTTAELYTIFLNHQV